MLFAAGKVSVVIHLRRSDLERGDTRATPDEYYYRLAKEIGQILPAELLDFHVWSSTKNIPAYDYHYWTSKDYDGYRERGMTVHLDEQIDNNDDMIKAWTHMARADIFIMSQSSFSMVPAYMNTNCVIYPSNIDAPLENWINGRNEARESGSKPRLIFTFWDPFWLCVLVCRTSCDVASITQKWTSSVWT